MNSDVWINGHHLGNHPYGYTPFYYDLTPYLKQSGENILAVRVRNEGKNSRWYSGSGIYRHVWLTVTNLTHVEQWGVYITTPNVSAEAATINIKTVVVNAKYDLQLKIRTQILDANNKVVAF
jgi:beta-galactosidase